MDGHDRSDLANDRADDCRDQELSRREIAGAARPGLEGFRGAGIDSRLAAYERAKAEWLRAHPEADWKAIGIAFRRLAGDLGL